MRLIQKEPVEQVGNISLAVGTRGVTSCCGVLHCATVLITFRSEAICAIFVSCFIAVFWVGGKTELS